MIVPASTPFLRSRNYRRSARPTSYRRFGLGAVSASQLQSVQPGSQPSFITGSYPNATWTNFDSFNNGYGVYLPYTEAQITANAPANYGLSVLNQQVEDQYTALMTAALPALQSTVSSASQEAAVSGGQVVGGQFFSCVAHPGTAGCPGAPAPVAIPVPAAAASSSPSGSPQPAGAPSPGVISSSGIPASWAAQEYGSSPAGSGFSLSSVPWWGWAGAAVLAVLVVGNG